MTAEYVGEYWDWLALDEELEILDSSRCDDDGVLEVDFKGKGACEDEGPGVEKNGRECDIRLRCISREPRQVGRLALHTYMVLDVLSIYREETNPLKARMKRFGWAKCG